MRCTVTIQATSEATSSVAMSRNRLRGSARRTVELTG
jgi:hypothetical protein